MREAKHKRPPVSVLERALIVPRTGCAPHLAVHGGHCALCSRAQHKLHNAAALARGDFDVDDVSKPGGHARVHGGWALGQGSQQPRAHAPCAHLENTARSWSSVTLLLSPPMKSVVLVGSKSGAQGGALLSMEVGV